MADDLQLKDKERDFFKQEGYLSVDPFVPMAEIEGMRVIYDAMFNGGYKLEDGDFFDLATTARAKDKGKLLPQIMNPGGYEPKLRAGVYFRRAEAVAKQMLGPGAKFAFDHFIDKPIGIAHETPWHQDQGYWDKKLWGRERAVNFWLSLDKAELANGCMQYVPRSHEGPILDHSHVSKNPDVHGLVCDMPAELLAKAVACPLNPGGVALHWHNTLHYAGPNRTQNHRRAYIMVFNYVAPEA